MSGLVVPESETDANTLLDLLTNAPFSVPYLGQTVDWIHRSVQQDAELRHLPLGVAAEALQRLNAYAAGSGSGAGELAQRLADARHAVTAVRHDHYIGMAIGQGDSSGAARIHRGAEVRKVAAAVGRSRVVAGPTGTVVVTGRTSGNMAFRPVSPELAHQVKIAAREREGEAVRRSRAVRRVLAQHVRMVDWSEPATVGVVVDSRHETVSVSWWESQTIDGSSLWIEGGVRLLCTAVLSDQGYAVTLAPNGTLHVSA
ncbi:hypothetical protein ACTVZO_40015 [Streptomyces sp. IBSNAI002]|uniref:hypothetical protein n=1 Tax=Streptomyces sp. IBSNAI002 TaxID=3457500 RepID=UPI003FD14677